jgi:flagellar biosynthesis protein FlhG
MSAGSETPRADDAAATGTTVAAAPAATAGRKGLARIMAITSGKGGVGKTFLAANLAAALVRQGERVLVLDADLGLANLDVVLNLAPKVTLHDVFTGKTLLNDAILPAPGGFSVLLAGSGLVEYSRLTVEVREQLINIIETLAPRFDRILLDTGAGISDVVLFAVSLAHEVLVIATPEPTSMTDAYATIKVLATQQQRRDIQLVVNQVGRPGEGRTICTQLQKVVDQYVTPLLKESSEPFKLSLLGEIPVDPAVREAVQKRRLLLDLLPGCAAAQAVGAIAVKLTT